MGAAEVVTMIGEYECRSCGAAFTGPLRPTDCVACGSFEVTWVNFQALRPQLEAMNDRDAERAAESRAAVAVRR